MATNSDGLNDIFYHLYYHEKVLQGHVLTIVFMHALTTFQIYVGEIVNTTRLFSSSHYRNYL